MRKLKTGSAGGPEMRHFPRFIVPLLLFLIVVLLGSLVWLQYDQREREREHSEAMAERRNRLSNFSTPWPDWPDAGVDPDDETASQPAPEPESRRPAGAEVVRSSEPRRLPPPVSEPPAEPKPDPVEARLEQALAQGGIEEALSNDKNPWNVRVVWLEPPLRDRGLRTPAGVNDHFCGEAESLEAGWLRDVVPIDLSRRPERVWLLTGRVELTQPPLDPSRAAVIEGLGGRSIVNAGGWFVFTFTQQQWRERAGDGLKLRMPGYRLTGKDGLSPSQRVAPLAREPRGQPALTLTAEPAPSVALGVRYKPRTAMSLGLRAWLEIFNDRAETGKREIGLFIESDVPRDGGLTFLFPDPATWTDVPCKLGAVGEGWSSGPPVLLENFRAATPRDKLLRTAINVELERASTELVSGRVYEEGSQYPLGPVRVESVHTGVRTVTDSEGAFRLWVAAERSDWDRFLRVDPLFMRPLQFAIDDEDKRPPNVSLETRGVAPVGPWQIRLPSRPARAGSSGATLYVAAPTRITALFVDSSQINIRVLAQDSRGVAYATDSWPGKYVRIQAQLADSGILVDVEAIILGEGQARELMPGSVSPRNVQQLVPVSRPAD